MLKVLILLLIVFQACNNSENSENISFLSSGGKTIQHPTAENLSPIIKDNFEIEEISVHDTLRLEEILRIGIETGDIN